MDLEKSKEGFRMVSMITVVMALGLLIPWPLSLHVMQFIAILVSVIVLNRQYSWLVKLYNEKRKDTADNNLSLARSEQVGAHR